MSFLSSLGFTHNRGTHASSTRGFRRVRQQHQTPSPTLCMAFVLLLLLVVSTTVPVAATYATAHGMKDEGDFPFMKEEDAADADAGSGDDLFKWSTSERIAYTRVILPQVSSNDGRKMIAAVYPSTMVKGQPQLLASGSLLSGIAALAEDPSCTVIMQNSTGTVAHGVTIITAPLCTSLSSAYYCEGDHFNNLVARSVMHLITLYDCVTQQPVNIVSTTLLPATPMVDLGVSPSLESAREPYISYSAACPLPSAELVTAQRLGYTPNIGNNPSLFVCVTSRDSTLVFTTVSPTVTVENFFLIPRIATVGNTATFFFGPPALYSELSFWSFGPSEESVNGCKLYTSSASDVAAGHLDGGTALWPWGTPAGFYHLCSLVPIQERSGKPDSGSTGDSLSGTVEDDLAQSHIDSFGLQQEGFWAISNDSYFTAVQTMLRIDPPVVITFTPPITGGSVCAVTTVPGNLYSQLPQQDQNTTGDYAIYLPYYSSAERGMYLMPTTPEAFEQSQKAFQNLCGGTFTALASTDSSSSSSSSSSSDSGGDDHPGNSPLAYVQDIDGGLVCFNTTKLIPHQFYVVCAGTPDGFRTTNTSMTLTAVEVQPPNFLGGEPSYLRVIALPSTAMAVSSIFNVCKIDQNMPQFTTNASGVAYVSLVIKSSEFGIPDSPLPAGEYTVCQSVVTTSSTYRAMTSLHNSANADNNSYSFGSNNVVGSLEGSGGKIPTPSAAETSLTAFIMWTPAFTIEVYDVPNYAVSSHTIVRGVSSRIFLRNGLVSSQLLRGFYISALCSGDPVDELTVINWSLVAGVEDQIIVLAPEDSDAGDIDDSDGHTTVFLCALVPNVDRYTPVPVNGISIIDQPLLLPKNEVPTCSQLNIFFKESATIPSGTTLTLVDGFCCDPNSSVVQNGVMLGPGYSSFLINDTTMAHYDPHTHFSVCATVKPSTEGSSDELCVMSGDIVIASGPQSSLCDVNPGVLNISRHLPQIFPPPELLGHTVWTIVIAMPTVVVGSCLAMLAGILVCGVAWRSGGACGCVRLLSSDVTAWSVADARGIASPTGQKKKSSGNKSVKGGNAKHSRSSTSGSDTAVLQGDPLSLHVQTNSEDIALATKMDSNRVAATLPLLSEVQFLLIAEQLLIPRFTLAQIRNRLSLTLDSDEGYENSRYRHARPLGSRLLGSTNGNLLFDDSFTCGNGRPSSGRSVARTLNDDAENSKDNTRSDITHSSHYHDHYHYNSNRDDGGDYDAFRNADLAGTGVNMTTDMGSGAKKQNNRRGGEQTWNAIGNGERDMSPLTLRAFRAGSPEEVPLFFTAAPPIAIRNHSPQSQQSGSNNNNACHRRDDEDEDEDDYDDYARLPRADSYHAMPPRTPFLPNGGTTAAATVAASKDKQKSREAPPATPFLLMQRGMVYVEESRQRRQLYRTQDVARQHIWTEMSAAAAKLSIVIHPPEPHTHRSRSPPQLPHSRSQGIQSFVMPPRQGFNAYKVNGSEHHLYEEEYGSSFNGSDGGGSQPRRRPSALHDEKEHADVEVTSDAKKSRHYHHHSDSKEDKRRNTYSISLERATRHSSDSQCEISGSHLLGATSSVEPLPAPPPPLRMRIPGVRGEQGNSTTTIGKKEVVEEGVLPYERRNTMEPSQLLERFSSPSSVHRIPNAQSLHRPQQQQQQQAPLYSPTSQRSHKYSFSSYPLLPSAAEDASTVAPGSVSARSPLSPCYTDGNERQRMEERSESASGGWGGSANRHGDSRRRNEHHHVDPFLSDTEAPAYGEDLDGTYNARNVRNVHPQ